MTEETVPEQVRVRLEKRSRMLSSGIDPYPVSYPRTTTMALLRDEHGSLPPDTATGRSRASRAG